MREKGWSQANEVTRLAETDDLRTAHTSSLEINRTYARAGMGTSHAVGDGTPQHPAPTPVVDKVKDLGFDAREGVVQGGRDAPHSVRVVAAKACKVKWQKPVCIWLLRVCSCRRSLTVPHAAMTRGSKAVSQGTAAGRPQCERFMTCCALGVHLVCTCSHLSWNVSSKPAWT